MSGYDLCVCGHASIHHTGGKYPMCSHCFTAGNPNVDYGHEYQQDNLKYLEKKYAEKNI